MPMNLAAIEIHVATPEDLLLMKLMAGRAHDEQDIAGIVSVAGQKLDWDYCQEIAEQLSGSFGDRFR